MRYAYRYGMAAVGWRAAMQSALYGTDGFFVRPAEGPADHFRTSVHASPVFADAVLRLLRRVDDALGRPPRLDVVDVGAGRGELLAALAAMVHRDCPGWAATGTRSSEGRGRPRSRIRFTAVEVAPRPPGLDPRIAWRRSAPDGITGLLIATEWLDNVPVDVALISDGQVRRVLVDPATGEETIGGPVDAADRFWLARWADPGRTARIEIGWPRDRAWAEAVARVRRGTALAVDYGHLRGHRPPQGTLTGFRGGRQVEPVPDGSCDVTAHVAMDAVASAAGAPYRLLTQREALQALGVDGARPPLDLARTDPAGYLRALAAASSAAELLEPSGLGGHWWLLHTIGIDPLALHLP